MGGPEDRYTSDTMNYFKDMTPYRPGIDDLPGSYVADRKAMSKEVDEIKVMGPGSDRKPCPIIDKIEVMRPCDPPSSAEFNELCKKANGTNFSDTKDRVRNVCGVAKNQRATSYDTMTFAEFDKLVGLSRQVESNHHLNEKEFKDLMEKCRKMRGRYAREFYERRNGVRSRDEILGELLIKWGLLFVVGLVLGYCFR